MRVSDVLDFFGYLRLWRPMPQGSDTPVTVYVSLTTIPSRMPRVDQCIQSLVEQTHPPAKIFLCVPQAYRRFGIVPPVPANLSRFGTQLEVVRCIDDFGPGTKALGALERIPQEPGVLLVLVDDDMLYARHMLAAFAQAYRESPDTSRSFYTYPYRGITIGQGQDGFALPAAHLSGMREFFEAIRDDPHLFLVDDLWISFFMRMKGAPAARIQHHLRKRGPIYRIYNSFDRLDRIKGDFSQRQCMARGREVLRQRFGV